jgi:hypothetical protein
MNAQKFTPFPIGTIRGPFTCGLGNDSRSGVQFAVNTNNGWVYFIERQNLEAKARKRAEEFAKTIHP